jgi:hypothetical protein
VSGAVVDVRELLSALDGGNEVEQNAGGWWARRPDLDVPAMARLMREREVRLVTISARPDVDGGHVLIYHWDAGPAVVNISTRVAGGVPTIAHIIPGADWAEREIRDYYGLDFVGRAQTPTLMLREGDPVGLFSRTGELGRDTDPATTARRLAESEETGSEKGPGSRVAAESEEGEPK